MHPGTALASLRTLCREMRDLPAEIVLGIEARDELRKLHAYGWRSVDDIVEAWADAETRALSVERSKPGT